MHGKSLRVDMDWPMETSHYLPCFGILVFDTNNRLRSRVGLQDRVGEFRGSSGGGENISEGYSWNCWLPLDMSCGDQVMGQSGVKRDLYPGLSSPEW